MENLLQILLVLVGVALLLASLSVLLALICLYRLVQQRPPSFSWTMSSSPPGSVTLVPPVVEAPKLFRRRRKAEPVSERKPYICIHCKASLPSVPHHGIVREEKSLVVYLCEKCGKETTLPPPPSADDAPQNVV